MSGKWIIFDNFMPNNPVAVNLSNVADLVWEAGILKIDYIDGTAHEYECEKSVFIQIASKLDIIEEIE